MSKNLYFSPIERILFHRRLDQQNYIELTRRRRLCKSYGEAFKHRRLRDRQSCDGIWKGTNRKKRMQQRTMREISITHFKYFKLGTICSNMLYSMSTFV